MNINRMPDRAELDDLNAKYSSAADHSIDMPMHDAEKLSALLAVRIKAKIEPPDLLVGLANGALMPTVICSELLGVPFHVICVRHRATRYKRRLLVLRKIIPFPQARLLNTLKGHISGKLEQGFPELEISKESLNIDVKGLNIVLIDDCIVSGYSIARVADILLSKGAKTATKAVICWCWITDERWMKHEPDLFLHRNIQTYPWSNMSSHNQAYLCWLNNNNIREWF